MRSVAPPLAALLLLSLSAAVVAQPTVVATDPALDAADVQGPILTIGIRFSEPMQPAWSLIQLDEGAYPTEVGDPWFEDPQTFRMKVEVKPDTTYALGLNSRRHQGFKSQGGVALQPTVFRFRTAAQFGGQPPQPPADQTVQPPAAALPGPPAFPLTWETGETMETISTTERQFDYQTGAGRQGVYADKSVMTVATQVLAVEAGVPTLARAKAMKLELTEPDPQTGQPETTSPPAPGFVLEAQSRGGQWTAQVLGAQLPPEFAGAFADQMAVGCPFDPRKPVQVGDEWELSGKQLQVALAMVGSEGPVEGKVSCKYNKTYEVDGEPAAQIIHTWQVKLVFQGLMVDATGQGGSTYLPNAGKFVSHTILLDCAVPRQQGPGGDTFTAKGTQKVNHRHRYFAPGGYEKLEPSAAPQGAGLPAGFAGVEEQQPPATAPVVTAPATAGGFPPASGGFPVAGGGFPQAQATGAQPAGGGFPAPAGGFPAAGGGFPQAGAGGPQPAGGFGPPGGAVGGRPAGGDFPTAAGGGFPATGGGFGPSTATAPTGGNDHLRALTGTWRASGGGLDVLLQLGADGRYGFQFTSGLGVEQEQGTFTATADTLVFSAAGKPDKNNVKYRLLAPNALELTPPHGITFVVFKTG